MRRIAIALLVGLLLGYTVGRTDASDSALSSPAGFPPLTTVGVTSDSGLLSGAPDETARVLPSSVGAPTPAARPSEVRDLDATEPSTVESVRGTPSPGTTAQPAEAWTRQGIVNWATESHGPTYLALPIGPGHRVELCGPGGCLTLLSTDAGPDLERQRAGRIADLAVELWESISGVPRGYGGFVGTWTLVP